MEKRVFYKCQTLYDYLGIHDLAEPSEIRQAYLRLSMVMHPDKPGGSHESFVALNEIYSTLMDNNKKAYYDDLLPETVVNLCHNSDDEYQESDPPSNEVNINEDNQDQIQQHQPEDEIDNEDMQQQPQPQPQPQPKDHENDQQQHSDIQPEENPELDQPAQCQQQNNNPNRITLDQYYKKITRFNTSKIIDYYANEKPPVMIVGHRISNVEQKEQLIIKFRLTDFVYENEETHEYPIPQLYNIFNSHALLAVNKYIRQNVSLGAALVDAINKIKVSQCMLKIVSRRKLKHIKFWNFRGDLYKGQDPIFRFERMEFNTSRILDSKLATDVYFDRLIHLLNIYLGGKYFRCRYQFLKTYRMQKKKCLRVSGERLARNGLDLLTLQRFSLMAQALSVSQRFLSWDQSNQRAWRQRGNASWIRQTC